MTHPHTMDDKLATGHTPGPWDWFGSDHGLYLATVHGGRRYVMGFRRHGLNGAQPTFQVANRMVPAANLVEFEVGDRSVRGFAEARKNGSVYRYDVIGIDAPDARLIAAAPELLAALRELRGWMPPSGDDRINAALANADAALAKAEGKS